MARFRDSEFVCRCCGKGKPTAELMRVLTDLGNYYGSTSRIDITGPLRCEKRNTAVGGAKDSRHLLKHSDGVDIKVFLSVHQGWEQVPAKEVAEAFERLFPGRYGMGIYSNRIHVDTRPGKAKRWVM